MGRVFNSKLLIWVYYSRLKKSSVRNIICKHSCLKQKHGKAMENVNNARKINSTEEYVELEQNFCFIDSPLSLESAKNNFQ